MGRLVQLDVSRDSADLRPVSRVTKPYQPRTQETERGHQYTAREKGREEGGGS